MVIMRFAVLGSCVGHNTIDLYKNNNWTICASCISVNPFSMLETDLGDLAIEEDLFDDVFEKNGECFKLRDEITNSILNKIQKTAPDYLLIDFADLRLSFNVKHFTKENDVTKTVKISYTASNASTKYNDLIVSTFEKKYGLRCIKEETIRVSELSDEKIMAYLQRYYSLLLKYFDKSRIIVIKTQEVNQSIHNGEIGYLNDVEQSGRVNALLERVYKLFSRITDYVEFPERQLCDESVLSKHPFHYCRPYYEFLSKSITNVITNGFNKENQRLFMAECEKGIDKLIYSAFYKNVASKIVDLKEKKIVLVAKNKSFEDVLFNRSARKLDGFIEYDVGYAEDVVSREIAKYRSDNTIFLVPEAYRNEGGRSIIELFYENGLTNGDYCLFNYPTINLKAFTGVFSDVFNNRIIAESRADVQVMGCASMIHVGKNCSNVRIRTRSCSSFKMGDNCDMNTLFDLWYGSMITIGAGTIMCDGRVASTLCSKLFIGEDVMISFEEMIFSGDGHAIFVKDGEDWKNMNPCNKDIIRIGDHVWIGYGCRVLSGADIGEGSIVGAGSVVNKKFPNNVIIAGVPAKVIKKNVAWSRNVFPQEIKKDRVLFEKYAKETKL